MPYYSDHNSWTFRRKLIISYTMSSKRIKNSLSTSNKLLIYYEQGLKSYTDDKKYVVIKNLARIIFYLYLKNYFSKFDTDYLVKRLLDNTSYD